MEIGTVAELSTSPLSVLDHEKILSRFGPQIHTTFKLRVRIIIHPELMRQTSQNIVASIIDLVSILVAYRIGVQELGILSGLLYGLFDAWLVVWQRERISNFIQWAVTKVKRIRIAKHEVALPFAKEHVASSNPGLKN